MPLGLFGTDVEQNSVAQPRSETVSTYIDEACYLGAVLLRVIGHEDAPPEHRSATIRCAQAWHSRR